MAIDPLSASRAYQAAARAAAKPPAAEGGDTVEFGGLVKNAVQAAQDAGLKAEKASLAAAAGRADIVDVVTAVAAAETTLETVIAVRDQVINAYQEILRMPI